METPAYRSPSEDSWKLSRDWSLIALAAVTLILGIWGFALYRAEGAECPKDGPIYFLTPVYRALVLFEPSEANIRLGECYPIVQIAIARFTGIAALILGAVQVLRHIFRGPIEGWRVARSRDHSVILGFGEIGQVRAIELASRSLPVLAVDSSSNDVLNDTARRHGILLVRGEARSTDLLNYVKIDRAREVTVALGDDTRSLAAAQHLAGRDWGSGRRQPRIEVSLTDPLIRRALNSSNSAQKFDVFSVEEAASATICHSARFFEIADLLGQPGIHLVFVGFAPITPIIVAQVLRTCSFAGFGNPIFTFITPGTASALAQLVRSFPGTDLVAELNWVEHDPGQGSFDNSEILRRVAAHGPVTAVIVTSPRGEENLPLALGLREAARRTGWWRAPIFWAAGRTEPFRDIDNRVENTKRFSDVLHGFETSARLCGRWETEMRDRIAKAIHEAYRDAFQRMTAEGEKPSQGGEALVPWDELPHTYRQANRRVADHLPAKLLNAGCYVPRDNLVVGRGFDLLGQPGMLDRLAALEHQAWMIDRLLEGWRYGPRRDNARRIHDCLVPYEQLAPETQELDRQQIRSLHQEGIPRSDTARDQVRPDLWIGLLGEPDLTLEQTEWLKGALQRDLMPGLLGDYRNHYVSVLSTMSPGAGLVLTESSLEFLSANRRPHRLLGMEAVPIRDAVDRFETSWRSGSAGCLDGSIRSMTWEQARDALMKRIEEIELGPACARVLELYASPPDRQATSEAGYQRQNAYLVRRAHVLIAVAPEGTSERPDGTTEAVRWRRDPNRIPAALPAYSPRPNHALRGTPGMIIIDPVARAIRTEP